MANTVRIRGKDAFRKWSRDFTRETDKWMERELKETGEDMVEHAKSIVPVRTGFLQRHIRKWVGKKSLTVGTFDTTYSDFVELGTSKMEAQPFIGPAFDKFVPIFARKFDRFLKRI